VIASVEWNIAKYGKRPSKNSFLRANQTRWRATKVSEKNEANRIEPDLEQVAIFAADMAGYSRLMVADEVGGFGGERHLSNAEDK
jgi:class 3 adenylate cyclase